MSRIANALRNLFTVPRQSAAASQPHTQEGRKVNLSETRPKRRLIEFFGQFKSLFTRKDRKDIASRTVTTNVDTTPIRDSGLYVPVPFKSARLLLPLMLIVDLAKPCEELNVTKDYIQEFDSNNISFTNLDGKTKTGKTLKLTRKRQESYSDHLTQFCGGDKGQALQLSTLLTTESLNTISPIIKEGSYWLESRFDVSKGEGGNIKVEVKGKLVDQQGNETKVQNITIIVPPKGVSHRLSIKAVTLVSPLKT